MKLVEIADAYVILKGGTGTLLEFAAVWEFMNKRVIDGKPILVIGNFWPPVVNTLKEELVYEGKGEATKFVTIVANLQDCVNVLNASFGEK
jgi:predicted Rossmann-fold nucleotide-binding protein